MNKCFYKWLGGILLGCISFSAAATDIADVYNQAKCMDPEFQAAYTTMLSEQENLPQATANLLPNISGTANTTYNYINILNIAGLQNTVPGTNIPGSDTGSFKFNSSGYTITLNQPIINFSAWMTVKQQSNVYKKAAADYAAATQDLIVRVAKAYFAVLQAQDNLVYSQAQKAANERQLDQAKQRFQVGLDAITSVYNAQASYDSATATVIARQNDLANALEGLRQITGVYYCNVEGLKIKIPLQTPCPICVDDWVAAAEHYNQELLSTCFNAQAARNLIGVAFGGHIPTLNTVATWGQQNGQSYGTVDYRQGTIGLQLNVPIYQGGAVNSQVRQAEDNYGTAIAEMEQQRRKVVLDTRQNYNDVMLGISKIAADRAAIISAKSSVESTEESFKVGTRTIVDVLIAQNQLFQARTTYAQDLYAYLTSTLELKQAAGTLCPNDLVRINVWLHARGDTAEVIETAADLQKALAQNASHVYTDQVYKPLPDTSRPNSSPTSNPYSAPQVAPTNPSDAPTTTHRPITQHGEKTKKLATKTTNSKIVAKVNKTKVAVKAPNKKLVVKKTTKKLAAKKETTSQG